MVEVVRDLKRSFFSPFFPPSRLRPAHQLPFADLTDILTVQSLTLPSTNHYLKRSSKLKLFEKLKVAMVSVQPWLTKALEDTCPP